VKSKAGDWAGHPWELLKFHVKVAEVVHEWNDFVILKLLVNGISTPTEMPFRLGFDTFE
jgi:hypothetical protein